MLPHHLGPMRRVRYFPSLMMQHVDSGDTANETGFPVESQHHIACLSQARHCSADFSMISRPAGRHHTDRSSETDASVEGTISTPSLAFARLFLLSPFEPAYLEIGSDKFHLVPAEEHEADRATGARCLSTG